VQNELTDMGWTYLVVWECEVKDKVTLAEKLQLFLD